MRTDRKHGISRRDLLAAGAAVAATSVLSPDPARAAAVRDYRLVAGTAQAQLAGPGYPTTVPGMPAGSPGMLAPGESPRPLTVYEVAADAAPGAAPKVSAVE